MAKSSTLSVDLLLKAGGFERGMHEAASATKRLDSSLSGLKREQIAVRESSLRVSQAQDKLNALMATGRARGDQLEAAEIRLQKAQLRLADAQERTNLAMRRGHKAQSAFAAGLKSGARGVAAFAAAYVSLDIVKQSVNAFAEAEKSQARLTAQLKASGISYRAHAKEIDNVIQRTSLLAGLDDEALQDAFTNIVRVTGKVNQSLRLVGLAADFARGKQIDVAKAGEIVGKVAGGNVGVLKRYGVQLEKGATASQALAALQKKFGGQAEAYGKTTAGSMDRLSVASENLKEKAGSLLAPALASAADKVARFLSEMQSGTGGAGRFAASVSSAFAAVKGAVSASLNGVVLPLVKRLLPAFRAQFNGIVTVIRGFTDAINGIFHGDFRKAFGGIKGIVSGALRGMLGMLRGMTAPARAAAAAIGGGIVSGVASGARSIGSAVSRIGSRVVTGIRGLVERVATAAASVGKAIVNGAVNAIKSAPGAIKDALLSLVPGGKIFKAVGKALGFNASGRAPGVAQLSVVGEGGGPELVGNASRGFQVVSSPRIMALQASDYVIPTEPRYAGAGAMLMASALGIPGYAKGKDGKKDKWRFDGSAAEKRIAVWEGRWQIASQTPGARDDLARARGGMSAAKARVRTLTRLARQNPARYASALSQAISEYETWKGRVKDASDVMKRVPGAASGVTSIPEASESPVSSSAADNSQTLADILQELRVQNQRAAALANTSDGALAMAVTNVISGQIGGRAGLGFQTPSYTGNYARY